MRESRISRNDLLVASFQYKYATSIESQNYQKVSIYPLELAIGQSVSICMIAFEELRSWPNGKSNEVLCPFQISVKERTKTFNRMASAVELSDEMVMMGGGSVPSASSRHHHHR